MTSATITTMLKARVLVFALAMLISGTIVYASEPKPLSEQIDDMLSERHPDTGGAAKERWRSFGKEAPDVMIGMFGKAQANYKKIRILEMLGHFGDHDRAKEFIEIQARETDSRMIRIGALHGARRMGNSDLLEEFLNSSDKQTRSQAAIYLQDLAHELKSEGLRKKVEDFIENERTGWIIQKLHRAKNSLEIPLLKNGKVIQQSDLQKIWSGKWAGYWVEPDQKDGSLTNYMARLEIHPKAKGVSGQLVVEKLDTSGGPKSMKPVVQATYLLKELTVDEQDHVVVKLEPIGRNLASKNTQKDHQKAVGTLQKTKGGIVFRFALENPAVTAVLQKKTQK